MSCPPAIDVVLVNVFQLGGVDTTCVTSPILALVISPVSILSISNSNSCLLAVMSLVLVYTISVPTFF